MPFRVVLDANVLVPARLRDVLLTLAEADLYAPVWSDAILAEVRRNLPRSVGLDAATHLIEQMQGAFPEASTECDRGVAVEGLHLVNPKDQHVASLMVLSHADALLTEDKRLAEEVASLCDVMTVAEFLGYTVDVAPRRAASALVVMLARWPEADEMSPEDAWGRLTSWMDQRGWSAAAEQLLRHPPGSPSG